MTALVIIVFIIGYAAIAFEHVLRLNKAAAALLTGVLCWTLYVFSGVDSGHATESLFEHFGPIASLLFFLLCAMTIVELIDSHDGFAIITNRITTRSKAVLLWIIGIQTFFISAVLDNLTTAIVMTSLTTKILNERSDRLWFAGLIIIAANAGGAFSPLGDVTTTMLWTGNQISAPGIVGELFFPSLCVCVVPLLLITPRFRGQTFQLSVTPSSSVSKREANLVFALGIVLLLFVPVFKTVTNLPPFMGMLLALGILWVVVSILHLQKPHEVAHKLTVARALERIDTQSILFFLGILLAVSCLESWGLLRQMAILFDTHLGNVFVIASALGLISAVVDNVPLIAAAQGMYDLQTYATDHAFWKLLALTTGTGGSIIIIGSAAGVAAMGIVKIEFMWYLKNIGWIALVGAITGAVVFIAQSSLL